MGYVGSAATAVGSYVGVAVGAVVGVQESVGGFELKLHILSSTKPRYALTRVYLPERV